MLKIGTLPAAVGATCRAPKKVARGIAISPDDQRRKRRGRLVSAIAVPLCIVSVNSLALDWLTSRVELISFAALSTALPINSICFCAAALTVPRFHLPSAARSLRRFQILEARVPWSSSCARPRIAPGGASTWQQIAKSAPWCEIR